MKYRHSKAMSDHLGTVTREQFNKDIAEFIEKNRALNENWCVRELQNAPECKYLVKRDRIPTIELCKDVKYLQNEIRTENIQGCSDEAEFDNTISPSDGQQCEGFLTFEYHVVYSPSYSVPVLYFSAWMQDGKRLSLSDIWAQVSKVHQHFLHHDKWSFITQQEHPLLQQPFFLVHPCHTADFMKLLSRDSSTASDKYSCSYIITWLSAVGPTVGLRLPLQLAIDK